MSMDKSTRAVILDAAHLCGITNAHQFGLLAESIGVCAQRQATNYYNGTSDLTSRRLDKLLEYFGLEVK